MRGLWVRRWSCMRQVDLTARACSAVPLYRVKSGSGSGTIGKLTGGLLTRQGYYEQAVLCALVPLLNPTLYPGWGGAGAAASAAGE